MRQTLGAQKSSGEKMLDNAILKGIAAKKWQRPMRTRDAVAHACKAYGVSQRRVCDVVGVTELEHMSLQVNDRV